MGTQFLGRVGGISTLYCRVCFAVSRCPLTLVTNTQLRQPELFGMFLMFTGEWIAVKDVGIYNQMKKHFQAFY